MFTPVRKNAFSWSTPDPAEPWLMVGHLFVRETGIVFVDPPLVPGLLDAAKRFGNPEALVLTTQNHTRAAKYIARKTGIPVYLPEQDESSLDPREVINVKAIGDYETFKEGEVIGFEVYKFGEDYALVTEEKELLVGDNAIGDSGGMILPAPDWFPRETEEQQPDQKRVEFRNQMVKELREIVAKSGATSLLPSHGYDVLGNLERKVREL